MGGRVLKKSRQAKAVNVVFRFLGPLFIVAIVGIALSILACTSPRQTHADGGMRLGLSSGKL